MFDLEQSIANWRRQMLAAGIKTPVPLEELKIHLREEIERQIQTGIDEQQAFEIAVQKVGDTNMLKNEFKKVDAENWNRPLAWSAWILFVVSFFLPTYGFTHHYMPGWKCSLLPITDWKNLIHGDLPTVHLMLLAFANILMITSPFLLFNPSQSSQSLKWLRLSSFAALILVCSFLLLLTIHKLISHTTDFLTIGGYFWATSFLLLYLSTVKIRGRKMRGITN